MSGKSRGVIPSPAPVAPPPTSSRQWTAAQQRGITTSGHSLLVSAAAGSGKTAMLAERCAYLVCDAPEPCDVDELLVVTFTEAAAAEMKSRIHAALRSRARAGAPERITRQLALVEQAQVSTLHSFCARILREYFHLVSLDPGFNVMDGEEAHLLRLDVARELLDDRYELDEAGDFHRFIDSYGDGQDERLLRLVIHTHEMLCSLVAPDAWLAASRERIREAAGDDFLISELGRGLVQSLSSGLAALRERCAAATAQVSAIGGFEKYLPLLREMSQFLNYWETALREGGPDALAEVVQDLELPKLPSIPNSVPGKEVAKAAIDAVRGGITKGAWRDTLRFSTRQWQEGLQAIQPHAEIFLGLVEQFGKRYVDAKQAARAINFSDLERLALKVLRELGDGVSPSAAARAFQRRFAHVLVDEYQDINETQDAILWLVSRESSGGAPDLRPNLFTVGDVKQSIYRFRLAEPTRFLDRRRTFLDDAQHLRGEVIDLQSNFRSRGPLLEAINGVFERLMTAEAADIEYDATQRLHPGLAYPPGDGCGTFAGSPIELHLLPDKVGGSSDEEEGEGPTGDEPDLDRAEREAVLIAERIRSLMGMGGAAPMSVMEKDASGALSARPIRFRDMVILLRSMRFKADQIADVLREAGIPVHSESGTGYFESMEVRDMLSLLHLLDNQRQDIPMAAVLRSPLGRLAEPEDAMARVRLAYPATGESAVPFHDAVVRYAAEHRDEMSSRLRAFLKDLERWRELAQRRPPAELVGSIYEQTGYLTFVAGLADGEQRVANLKYLHERAEQFGSFQRQGLSRFLALLEDLQEGSDLGQPSVASEADDVVRIMSIHRSKGLEFPVVILPDLGKAINLQDCRGNILVDRAAGLGMSVIEEERRIRYPSLASMLVQQRLKQQALAEELRVLYVAMTRAKEHLILLGTCRKEKWEKWLGRWSDHRGPLPADEVLGARSMLDWLGPVAAITADSGAAIIHTQAHDPDQVQAWQSATAPQPEFSAEQRRLAALEPLEPAPDSSDVADAVIRRLAEPYPHEAFTTMLAARAVTSPTMGAAAESSLTSQSLELPAFLRGGAQRDPAQIGNATHLLLRHLDFRRPCDGEDLAAQVKELIERRLISSADAALVDREAIAWLLSSELGPLLRGAGRNLYREIPVYFSAADPHLPASSDPFDAAMVRGRIDVLIDGPDGAVLIDYKTDSITPERTPERAATYAAQIGQYRQAVEQITGKPVARAYFVFLAPRVIVAV